jgi:hypothetical protein
MVVDMGVGGPGINPGQFLLGGAVEQQYLHDRQGEIEPGAEHRVKAHDNKERRRGVRARLWARVRGRRAGRGDRT